MELIICFGYFIFALLYKSAIVMSVTESLNMAVKIEVKTAVNIKSRLFPLSLKLRLKSVIVNAKNKIKNMNFR